MTTELLYLPSDIPIVPVEISGYVASSTAETALLPTGLPECERTSCGLRGDRIPELLGGYEVMRHAAMIALEKERCREKKGRLFGSKEPKSFGHVFYVTVAAGIAVPSPRLATAMARGTAADIWDELRPYAEGDQFQGIELPLGTVIFKHARDGHYTEELLASVPVIDLSDPD